MRYAILCYSCEAVTGSWTKQQDDAALAKRGAVKQELAAQGRLGPVARLMPTTAAVTVRSGNEPVVIDGPFAETKEQLLGIYFIECDTLEAAIDAARRMSTEPGALEIRPVRSFEPGSGLT